MTLDGRRFSRLGVAVVGLAAIAVYANSLRGGFVFDDLLAIPGNSTLRHGSTAFFPPHGRGATVEGRPILNLSFALNWAISGTRVWSYHLVNALIHAAAGVTLLGILRRFLSPAAALVAALLWVVHPLQTESVAYISQRAESLMGLFYLSSVYFFLRYAEASAGPGGDAAVAGGAPGSRLAPAAGSARYAQLAVLTCWLGMSTKENMVSAPVMILLIDRAVISGSFRTAWRRHRRVYLGLFASWLWLALLVVGTGNRGHTSGFGSGVSIAEYWPTQFPAVVRYLRLAFWPVPLVFDYGTQWVKDWSAIVAPALVVAALAGAALYGLARNRRWALPMSFFLPCWHPTV